MLARDGPVLEQDFAQLAVEHRIVAPDPFERHRRMLDLLVAVVRENRAKIGIGAGVDALVVPVDRLQLLDQRDDRAMEIHRCR
jgi:hypothetical protein